MIGLGTTINSAAIAAGGIIGLFAGKLFKSDQQEALNKACGVSVIFVAVSGAIEGMLTVNGGRLSSGGSRLRCMTKPATFKPSRSMCTKSTPLMRKPAYALPADTRLPY